MDTIRAKPNPDVLDLNQNRLGRGSVPRRRDGAALSTTTFAKPDEFAALRASRRHL